MHLFVNGTGNVAGSISITSESRTGVSRVKQKLIDIFGCQHPFCFVDRLDRSGDVMALMPDRIKVGVRSRQPCPGRLF